MALAARVLSPQQIKKAAKWTDDHLTEIGETRESLHEAWLATPGGKAAKADGHCAARSDAIHNDQHFINTVLAGPAPGDPAFVEGLQSFLFSDVGDDLAGAKSRPATKRERDGWFGPASDRRLELWRESLRPVPVMVAPKGDNLFLINGRLQELPGAESYRIIRPDQKGALTYADDQKGLGTWGKGGRKHARTVVSFAHWTAGLTAAGGHRVLTRRGFPTTALLDNPHPATGLVTVYQCFDPMKRAGTHGGTWPNRRSWLSGDFITPAYLKYAAKIAKISGKEPSRIRGHRNNGRSWVLGYWMGQIKAWLAMTTAVAAEAGMTPRIRTGRKGMPDFFPTQSVYPRGTLTKGTNGEFGNVLSHLESTAKKWDCAGLWLFVALAARLFPEVLACAPWLAENLDLDNPAWDKIEAQCRADWHSPELFGH